VYPSVFRRISAHPSASKRIKAKNLHAKMSQKPSFLLGKFAKTHPKKPSKNMQISRTNQACQAIPFPLAHDGPLAGGAATTLTLFPAFLSLFPNEHHSLQR
jgi:hypothetical protein